MDEYEKINFIKQRYRNQLEPPKQKWPGPVQAATKCIHENLYQEKLTIRWMKNQCYISNHNFSSRFAYYLGNTPKIYVINHRIKTAKVLLTHPDLQLITISCLSYELGYTGPAVFCNAFKSVEAMPPSVWRKNTMDSGSLREKEK